MTEFVRICPRCRHVNPEYENVCSQCDQFIGMENAVPAPELAPAPPDQPSEMPYSVAATQRYVPVTESFYLELLGSDQVFTVKSGWVMGQAHVTSQSQIQVPAEVEGCQFIHRQHCRFDLKDGQWQVTPLDQSRFDQEFTNPTFVNQHRIAPHTSHVLRDGDQLRLSGVSFIVRMP